MNYRINGAGPVGLMTACLLSISKPDAKIEIYEKRSEYKRDHNLQIDGKTIQNLIQTILLVPKSPLQQIFMGLIESFSNKSIRTSEIEKSLVDFLTTYTKTQIFYSKSVSEELGKNICIIGADGSKSQIRKKYFDDKLTDVKTVGYLLQVKYETSAQTRPRLTLSSIFYYLINALSGDDIVIDFESLSRKTINNKKAGTLHIPVSENIYKLLRETDKGTYSNPWLLSELKTMKTHNIEKLCGLISRYQLSLNFRHGNLGHPKITCYPLKCYRSHLSAKVVDFTFIYLIGDANSGLVYERGLNKGWLEVAAFIKFLSSENSIDQYNVYCSKLYNSEIKKILSKSHQIHSINSHLVVISLFIVIVFILLIALNLINSLYPVHFPLHNTTV